jgi:hypothetical protein
VTIEPITTPPGGPLAGVRAGTPPEWRCEEPLEINVVLGDLESAAPLLDYAASLATGIRARLTIHFPKVVPYPLPLKSPPVAAEFLERTLLDLSTRQAMSTSATLYLCRDRSDAIRQVLRPESLVILRAGSWWRKTFEKKLAKRLIRDGHRVVLLHTPRIK